MKKILLVIGLFLGATSFAQKKDDAPAAAKAAFAKAFPGAKGVWEKEDGNYEVSFETGGKKMSAIYDAKGALQESEVEITVSEVPATVSTYMSQHYKGITIKGAAKITKPDGSINYEAAIKGKDVLFDASGKFIKEAKD
jgi:hypothetical protein